MLLSGKQSFKSYFSKEIDSINSSLSFEIKNYLLELLCFYICSERLFEYNEEEGRFYESTLVDLYKKTTEADTNEKIYLFKKMGDLSLYFSGFFRIALERKIVPISYYEDMGQNAYGYLASHYGDKENVFVSLSEQFKCLGEVLYSVHQQSQKKSEIKKHLLFSFAEKKEDM